MAGSRIDTMIAECPSWEAFRELAEKQTVSKDKGDLFERLTQLYLITSPTYRSKLKNVWWCNNDELPERVRKKLNLPKDDEGIDLLCETFEGQFWSVQSKYRANSDKPLTTKELSKFLSLSFVTGKNISFGLIAHTSTKKVKKSNLMGDTTEIGLQNWLNITDAQWQQIVDVCNKNSLEPPTKREPRQYQQKAIDQAVEHFLDKKSKCGKLIMPCGTGKSLIAYWITRELNVKSVIVAVPSLALVKQSLEDWTSEYLAEGIYPNWIAVCSDDSVGNLKEADSTVATVYETGIPTTTDPSEIIRLLKTKSKRPKVIFTTYQSSKRLADACRENNIVVDLLIADEAHKTVGSKNKAFATLLFDANIKIKKRLFMTATERVYRQGTDNIVSMDDENVYGSTFHQMTFKEAIADEIICDYKILAVAVAEREVERLISENANVVAQLDNQKVETDLHNLAAGIAVEKVFAKHGIKHAVSFHRSIKRAESFTEQQTAFGGLLGNGSHIENRNISSKLSAGQRTQVLKEFIKDEKSLITNARCLTEGVDIPAIDCVAFVDPKQSVVDIVQAAGRAMRQSKGTGKKHGYILLPIIVPEGNTLEEFAETSDFRAVIRILTALSTQDERIAEELRNREVGQPLQAGDIINIDPDIVEALDVDYQTFYDGITTKVWETVGKANWRPFEEAREFSCSLGLSGTMEWFEWTKSDEKPADLPVSPRQIYKNTGWSGMADWLGTENLASHLIEYQPFEEAREFVQSLGLKNQKEWYDWAKTDKKPDDIPASPGRTYKNNGWIGYGDWLGTGVIAPRYKVYRPFEEAREFARSLGLKSSSEWQEWAKTDKRPADIPSSPSNNYKNNGWISSGDWLGTGKISDKDKVFRDFEEAKAYVRTLGLSGTTAWNEWAKSDKKPADIPYKPERTYKVSGWINYYDWLGKKF